jgi:multicomponent Na+:H+ antiporter subunit A
MFYETSVEMGNILGGPFIFLIPAAAVLGGVFTFAYSIKLIDGIFLGERHNEHLPEHVHEPPYTMLIPAGILAFFVIFIGIFPSVAVNNIIKPATEGILLEEIHLHVQLWHGFTMPLMMTFITLLVGIGAYTQYDRIATWQNRTNARYPWLSFNYVYDAIINGAQGKSATFGAFMQPGPLKPYLVSMILLFIALGIIPVLSLDSTVIPDYLNFDIPIYEGITFGLMIIAAIAAAFLKKYLHAIIAVSSVGYLVSLVFIYMQAPDLAITQILVETLTTIIFLLVIVKIPQNFHEQIPVPVMLKDIVISIAVAMTVLILSLNVSQGIIPPFESVSYYFVEKSVPLAAGHNIVNVILVDFRGYDTLGEIVVICLAALGVSNLIKSGVERK